MERRRYEEFVSLGAKTRPAQPGRGNPDQDPVRTAVEELKKRVKKLEEAKKREEENLKKLQVDEYLRKRFEKAGYGGVTITKTSLGTQVVIYSTRPGRVA